MGLALLMGGEGFAFSLPQWEWRGEWPNFTMALPWQEPKAESPPEEPVVEPKRRISDDAILGVSREPDPLVVQIAKEYLGVPYLYAGELERDGTMDCSAFTVLVFKHLDISLPRTTFGQVELGYEIDTIEDAKPGDLLFFLNTWPNNFQTGVTHVGIYIGNRKMIHSSAREGRVAITSINDPFYVEHWHSIRRILE